MARPDRTISEIAARPHGLITEKELDERGITVGERRAWIADGTLVRVNGRVLAVATAPATWTQQAAAALLAIPGASLGFESAARVLDVPFHRSAEALVLTAPLGVHAFVIGIDLRRTGRLPEAHLTETDGLRHTTLARTLVDLAGVTPETRLQEIVRGELSSKRLVWDEIDTVYRDLAGRGRPGIKRARQVLEAIEPTVGGSGGGKGQPQRDSPKR